MRDARNDTSGSSKFSQWDGSPSAFTPEGEIRVFERFAQSPPSSRSRRAYWGWAIFFTLMVVPMVASVVSWVMELL